MNYRNRLNNAIPGGAHTYSRGHDQYPLNAPQILKRGKGAYIYDDKDQEFLDYGMALRAVTVGYANEVINKAAIEQIEKGVNLTRPSIIELEAAELLIDLIPAAEMVKFAKNGSNVTTAAVKIARAYTGRNYICFPKQHPFFSFDDWFIGSTPIIKGIPKDYIKYSLVFDYNDLNSLEKHFSEHPGEISCVITEPATTILPCSDKCGCAHNTNDYCTQAYKDSNTFLHQVKELCHKNGALFILDEMITGFRWNLRGAQTYFNIEPDLMTFGKGMANGFSVAALAGKREFMELGGITKKGAERLFLVSTTHGAEMPGMGALVATINFYKENNVISHLWNYGKELYDGINKISRSLGLSEYFYMDGSYINMNYITLDSNKTISLAYRTLFSQEMIKNGVLMPWIAVSYSHGDKELKRTFEAVEKTLVIYKKALEDGIDKYLVGPAIKPVFRKYN